MGISDKKATTERSQDIKLQSPVINVFNGMSVQSGQTGYMFNRTSDSTHADRVAVYR
ncbi:MAG: hypothetical protein H6R25_1058 [Proteobacteria bacterium]|nr:hypothetical protein [Pseudomonadota bacterium]